MLKLSIITVTAVTLLAITTPAVAAPCVDVEKSSAVQLAKLKGIGPKLSKAIINFRKAHRSKATKAKQGKWMFRNWATLYKVKGIGPAICKANRAVVCFSGKIQKRCPRK